MSTDSNQRRRELIVLIQAAAPVARPDAERIADALIGHGRHLDPDLRPDLRPLEVAPVAVHPPYDQRRPVIWDRDADHRDFLSALYAPLAGIRLGTYDYRLLGWLAGWDEPAVGGLASLLHRARAAEPFGGAR